MYSVQKVALWAAAFGSAFGASCDRDIQIVSDADAMSIQSCTRFTGNIRVDGTGISELLLPSLRELEGDLNISDNFGMTRIDLSSLTSVNGNFELYNNTQLQGVSVSGLSTVVELRAVNNPNMRDFSFTNLRNVTIFQVVQNAIADVGTLNFSSAQDIEVTSNGLLRSLNLGQLESTSGYVLVADNHRSIAVDLSSLVEVGGNVSFTGVANVSIDALGTVKSDFSAIDNFLESLSLSNLTRIGAALIITDNDSINSLSFPELVNIGGSLTIANNTALRDLGGDSFASLESVSGGVILSGPFDDVAFPQLTNIDGTVDLQSTGNIDCGDFEDSLVDLVGGKVQCEATRSDSNGNNNNGSGSGGNSAANGIFSASLLSSSALAAAVVFSVFLL